MKPIFTLILVRFTIRDAYIYLCFLSQVSLNGDYIIILKKSNKKKDVNWLFSAKLPPPFSSLPGCKASSCQLDHV